MLKSLFITFFFPPKIGGIENYLENVCKNLPYDRTIVLTDICDDKYFDKKYNFKVIREELFPWKFIRPSWLPLIWRARKIIKKEKIEIVHFGHYSNLVSIGSFLKKPFFVYTHGVDLLVAQRSPFQRRLLIYNLKKSMGIIANSFFMKKEIIKLGVDPDKVIVCQPSLDIDRYVKSYDTERVKREYRLSNKKVILTIGRLIERKGQDMIIKSLPKILEKVPNTHYLIIGDGPYRETLENLIKEYKLDDKVTLIGSIEDSAEAKSPFLQVADVFAMPTRKISEQDIESFGIVYLEAQIKKLPVIASKIGGTSEAVRDKETGFLVNPSDIDEIANTIVELLADTELAKRMGENGRDWVLKHFNWQTNVEKIKNLIA